MIYPNGSTCNSENESTHSLLQYSPRYMIAYQKISKQYYLKLKINSLKYQEKLEYFFY